MKLLSHLWLVTLCASRYSVTYAETAMQSEWCWLECSGGSSKLFSGCWSQAHPWQEAAFLLLTFQTKQCQWMLVERVAAPKRNLMLFDTSGSDNLSTIFYTFLNSHYRYMVSLSNVAQLGTKCSWDTR